MLHLVSPSTSQYRSASSAPVPPTACRPHPVLCIAVELDCPDAGAEAPELIHPVTQGGLGHDDNVGPLDATVLIQVRHQADGLERLAQALITFKGTAQHSTVAWAGSSRESVK